MQKPSNSKIIIDNKNGTIYISNKNSIVELTVSKHGLRFVCSDGTTQNHPFNYKPKVRIGLDVAIDSCQQLKKLVILDGIRAVTVECCDALEMLIANHAENLVHGSVINCQQLAVLSIHTRKRWNINQCPNTTVVADGHVVDLNKNNHYSY